MAVENKGDTLVAGEQTTGETAATGKPDREPMTMDAMTDTDEEPVKKDVVADTDEGPVMMDVAM